MRNAFRSALLMGALTLGVLAAPGMASATVFVSTHAPSPPFNSCAHPTYSSVQEAVNAPTATVKVCAGTYEEQVQITKAVAIIGEAGAVVKLPASPGDSSTACDAAITSPYQPNQDEVSICTSATVSMTGLTIEAVWPSGTCYDSLYGVFVAGGATLKATNVVMDGAGASPVNGCQGGVGYEVGTARTSPAEVGHAIFVNDKVAGYQKNGITTEGAGSTITVSSSTVTGAGPTPELAQNGIQISYGAKGAVTKATVTGNECNHPTACGAESLQFAQSTGVLFYGAANGSSVKASTINENDVGVLTESSTETETTEPVASQILVSGNKLEADRYESVLISKGWTSVNSNTMTGGNVGIQLYQEAGQAYGPKGTGTGDIIAGMSQWAVQGNSDNQPTDAFGQFTIKTSKLSGNPGPTVAESVDSNNVPKLKLFTDKTDT